MNRPTTMRHRTRQRVESSRQPPREGGPRTLRDVRLSRLHPHLWEDAEEQTLRLVATHDGQTAESNTGGDQSSTSPPPTRLGGHDWTLAGKCDSGVAAISCRSGQHASARSIRCRGHQALAPPTATTQSTWPSSMALVANEPSCRSLPTAAKDPPPLSERPFSRSTCGKSRMRECFTYGSVRGAAGNGGPYRDPLRSPSATPT